MFKSTRLQLTAWYLLIIMIISLLFSLATYNRINTELVHLEEINERILERQQFFQRMLPPDIRPSDLPPRFDPYAIQQARIRLITALGVINAAVLVIAGGGGYFLAGRTLRPIQMMMDEQKRFVSDASHELRTPLTALRSEIEVNLRDPSLTLSEAKKLLKSNLEEVMLLQNLSDGLITLSKHDYLSRQTKSTITLQTLIASAVRKVQPLAKKKRIKIIQEGEGTKVLGNMHSLTELCVILLDNAIKYSENDTTITLRSSYTKQHGVLKFIDQGMGIAKKDLPHIFDRFYRADKARGKTAATGYGLGLSIAQKIVDEHEGEITVTSSPGKGSTFTVTLPRG